jgi:hypothetical protein
LGVKEVFLKPYRVFIKEKRLPYSWVEGYHRLRYKKSLDGTLKKILCTAPIPCDGNADVEIHVLTSSSDLFMALFSLKSILRFMSNVQVIVHGDETLTCDEAALVKHHIPGGEVILLSEANQLMQRNSLVWSLRCQIPERFTLGTAYAAQRKAWALKVFDFYCLARANKVVVLDSDTLFLKPPIELIEWIKEVVGKAFYAVPFSPNLRVSPDRCREVFPKAKVIESFNGGFYGFDRRVLTLGLLQDVVSKIAQDDSFPIYGDECIWRFVIGHISHQALPVDKYPLFATMGRFKKIRKDWAKVCYLHFLLKHRGGAYESVARRVYQDLLAM